MANISRFLFLLLFARGCEPFSGGAPLSACNDGMVPRHGFSGQTGDPPMEILMDQARITPDTYLRVTLRSQKAFKGNKGFDLKIGNINVLNTLGFLLRAEAVNDRHVGTWYIPYLADTSYLSESQYLHCNNKLQSAVTHSGKTSAMWVVSFQWRPPHQFYGWVTFR